ncbi:MAG: hypothetical protein AAFQ58_20220 [Pseudomonadota bacterium]
MVDKAPTFSELNNLFRVREMDTLKTVRLSCTTTERRLTNLARGRSTRQSLLFKGFTMRNYRDTADRNLAVRMLLLSAGLGAVVVRIQKNS